MAAMGKSKMDDSASSMLTDGKVTGIRGDYLIIFQTILLPVTFTLTYIIATSNDHVEKEFPYISDTGTWPPESCIFGLLLFFFAFTTFMTILIRWHILQRFSSLTISPRLNNISLCLGLVATFGVLLVATFQETSQIVVHLLGAFMVFFIGGIYMWFQTAFSWRTWDVPGFFKMVVYIRLSLTSLATVAGLGLVPLSMAANADYSGNQSKTTEPGTGKWNPDLGGYELHVAATSFEWVLAGLMSLFFLTFVREFRFVHFGLPKLHHSVHTNQLSDQGHVENGAVDNLGVDRH